MDNSIEKDFANCAIDLTTLAGEEVVVGAFKGRAFVGDQSGGYGFDGDGGSHLTTRLAVTIPWNQDLSSEIGQPATVRGKEYTVESVSFSGGENEAILTSESEG